MSRDIEHDPFDLFKYHRGRVARVIPKKQKFGYGPQYKLSVRRKAEGIVRRLPEVMIKIDAKGKSGGRELVRDFHHLKEAAAYISRNGKLEMENQDGGVIHGRDELKTELGQWQMRTMPAKDSTKKDPKLATRIVLSMPPGTDREKFHQAARAWAKENLDGYDWLLAAHNDTAHPHVHVLVRSRHRLLNKQFWVGKEDLQIMRESLVEKLHEQSIEANATRRYARGAIKQRLSQAHYHAVKDGRKWRNWDEVGKEVAQEVLAAIKKGEPVPEHDFLLRSKKTRAIVMHHAFAYIEELKRSGKADDAALSRDLSNYYRHLPPITSLAQRTQKQMLERIRKAQKRQTQLITGRKSTAPER